MTVAVDPLNDLRQTYPTWTIWRSDPGRYWAVRGEATRTDHEAGHRMSLDADDLDTLADLLAEQQRTAAATPE